jgi:hypothetical protein
MSSSALAAAATPPAADLPHPRAAGWPGWPVAAVAAAAVIVHLACGNRHGVFRDELYFVACGRHLAWGYVDQPPVIAVVARLAELLFGASPMGLRFPAYLAHAGTVFLTALLAMRLGGGPRARLVAATLALVAPCFLGGAHLLTMNAFEPLIWTGVTLGVVEAVDGDRRGGWLAVGAWVGIGLLNKYSIAFWVVALLLGLVATPARRALASGWLLAAVGVAAAIALPNFLWQAGRGFPMLELLGHMAEKNVAFTVGGLLLEVAKGINPYAIALWGAGLIALVLGRFPARRWLGIAVVAVVVLFVATHAKPYFLNPMIPALYAAGACSFERIAGRRWHLPALIVYLLATGAAMVPFALPVLSPQQYVALQARLGFRPTAPDERLSQAAPLPSYFADQLGWPELVESIARVHRRLPPEQRAHTAVLAPDYGVAAAIDFYGPALGLPHAVAGHNNYWYWGPPPDDTQAVLLVGPSGRDLSTALGLCGSLEAVGGTPDSEWNMPYERRRPIYLCTDISAPFRGEWERFRFVY